MYDSHTDIRWLDPSDSGKEIRVFDVVQEGGGKNEVREE